MADIFDKNLAIENSVLGEEYKLYRIPQHPFELSGNYPDGKNVFARMPDSLAKTVSQGVADRAARCAGVRLRFKTDSRHIGIKVSFQKSVQFPTQTAVSAQGFDLYSDEQYVSSFIPEDVNTRFYETVIDLGGTKERQITIYFPYNAVIAELFVGLDVFSYVEAPNSYRIKKPIVFYGSSITHGFCVSRPGVTFASIISRRMNADYINLGFSGVCHGELAMADYIGSLEKSVVICEFDHNEATAEDLKKKHLPFYLRLREKDSRTPIIFMSSPNRLYKGKPMYERMKIIEKTFEYARNSGDENVYFINGQEFYPGEEAFDCSVDGIHPNDHGSFQIAQKLYDELKKLDLK